MSLLDSDNLFEAVRNLVSECVPKIPIGEKLTIQFLDQSFSKEDGGYFVYFFRKPNGSFTISFGPPVDQLTELDASSSYVLRKSGWLPPNPRKLRAGFCQSGLWSRLDIERAFEEAIDGLLCATVMETPVAIKIPEVFLVASYLPSSQLVLTDPRENIFVSYKDAVSGDFFSRAMTWLAVRANSTKLSRLNRRANRASNVKLASQRPPMYSGLVVLVDHQQMPLCLMSIDSELNQVRWFDDDQWETAPLDSLKLHSKTRSDLVPIENHLAARVFPNAFQNSSQNGEEFDQ